MAQALAPSAPAARPTSEPVGRIGPNAVLQLAAALRAREGETATAAAFDAAGLRRLLQTPPETMVDERDAARLFATMRLGRTAEAADALLAEAGRRTADYVVENRIPRLARGALACAPRRIAVAALLRAIAANAWTFAGSGACRVAMGRPAVIEIADNPIITPGCPWHCAVFARMIDRLARGGAPRAVRHQDGGAPTPGDRRRLCRFEIDWERP